MKLIIVCDKKSKEYANYLMGLIGTNDDKEDKIVGIKDGSITAAIYTPKQYEDNLPIISSETNILFIGNFKEAKEHIKNVEIKFSRYGMNYGWLGKRAVMYVDDKMLNNDEYEEFIVFCKKYQEKYEQLKVDLTNARSNIFNFSNGALPVALTLGLVWGSINYNKVHKKIKDQQYRCLTIALYLEGLQQFMEG